MEGLKRRFFTHYFPSTFQVEKESKFHRLQQGNMNEEEFIAKFNELLKYLTYLRHHDDEEWKAEQFLNKIWPEYNREEAEASPKLIKGTISLYDTEIPALFDLGATHSFILNECVEKLKLLVTELLVLMNVSTLARAFVKTSRACLKVDIRFGNSITLIDLVCLPMLGIDVIVGMDWLLANKAILDYEKKIVSLPMCNVTLAVSKNTTSVVNLEIPKFLFAMQIKRSDCEGFQIFLVFFLAFGEYDGTLDKIGVVSKFLEVFIDKMFSLPPKREIEFSIDLVPGTKPISKALYHMALSELEELKKQLEELLEKGFIRSSVSP
ncbi:uncharacterized protein LOC129305440 [Prosopis cineraria]|uniref:uncharacterized protein LOC129305440 n=1 Tax=Prosopis cineraria TaxID=364024 RepID=UPI00240F26A2|nr:uncharacterized protein LOC129305440 [Prosopis cineraria]